LKRTTKNFSRREIKVLSTFLAWFDTPAYVYGMFIFIIIFAASSKALVGLFSSSSVIVGLVIAAFTVYYLYTSGILTGETQIVIKPLEGLDAVFPDSGTTYLMGGWFPTDLALIIATIAYVSGVLYFLSMGYKNRKITVGMVAVAVICCLVGSYFISPFFDSMNAGAMYIAAIAILGLIMFSYRRF